MKRLIVIGAAALAAAVLFAGFVHGVLVIADVSEPANTTVAGLTARRLWATTAAVLALIGVVSGVLALARPGSRFGAASGRLGSRLTLDRLSPFERAAFLLHDVFDFSFSDVATALERSEAACRQLAARARTHVRAARPGGAAQPVSKKLRSGDGGPAASSGKIDAKHERLLSAFVAASQSGDLSALKRLLASDVRVVSDGGGKVRAARNAIDGADRVAEFVIDATRKRPDTWWRADFTLRFAAVNGMPGVIVDAPEGAVQTAAFEIDDDLIGAMYVVRNPDKLRHLAAVPPNESGRG